MFQTWQRRLAAISAVALACAAGAACGQSEAQTPRPAVSTSAASAPTSSTALRVKIDSGYGLVFNSDGTVLIVSPKHSPSGPMVHIPKLKIVSGTPTGAPFNSPIDLTGYSFSAGSTGSVSTPATTALSQTADCSPEPSGAAANNLAFVPDLLKLHPGATLNLVDSKLDTKVGLAGGTLTLMAAHGCWSTGSGNPQSLATSEEVGVYEVTVAASKITLNLTPLSGATVAAKTIDISPDASGRVELYVTWPPVPAGPKPAVGDTMVDFARAYELLTLPKGENPIVPKRAALTTEDKKLQLALPKGDCTMFRYGR
jgi:hypothetical protein